MAPAQDQGVLLADGTVVLTGPFPFYGIVIARGSFSTSETGGAKIYGSVMAQSIQPGYERLQRRRGDQLV